MPGDRARGRPRLPPRRWAPLVWLALAGGPVAAAGHGVLPALNAALDQTTVSGISSGGYMAVQFQVSHSALVRGAAVIAGGPFGCAEGSSTRALGPCMEGTPDAAALADRARRLAAERRIDPTENLARHQVWLFSGRNDGVVRPPVVRSLEAFYRHFLSVERVFLQDATPAGHVFPSLHVTAACTATGGQFIANCGYDAAGELLQHLYGRLVQPTAGGKPAGRLIAFEQAPYVDGSLRRAGLAGRGYLFLPETCARGEPCRVHIAFHGCRQNAAAVGEAFVEHAGYNRWAAANRIAVLYPQTASTWGLPFNPKACWDWWGFTGEGHATRDGAQVRAVHAMLRQLTGAARSPTGATAPAGALLLSGEATDDALTVRWPSGYRATALWLLDHGQRRRLPLPAAGDTALVVRGLAPGRPYAVLLQAHPVGHPGSATARLDLATRATPGECDTYFSDNVRHVAQGRAEVRWARATAKGSGDDLGWWSVAAESQLTRTANGFRRGTCD